MDIICNNCNKENRGNSRFCSFCGSSLKGDIWIDEILSPGTILEKRYKIINLIRAGRTTTVYRGLDKKLDSICAIKELSIYHESEEEKEPVKKWFKREAKLLAKLDHPNLPKVFDYFIDNDKYYLVRTFITGEDFITILERDGSPGLLEEKVIEWAKEILLVLDYLHSRNPPVIYRDLKPDNIMRHRDGRIMLIDFGLARTVNPQDMRKTSTGSTGYAPAEQYDGKGEPRSDLYALGATMYHLLTGIVPSGFSFKPLKEVLPDINPSLENIVMKALKEKPEDRFKCAKSMLKALKKGDKPQKTYRPGSIRKSQYKIIEAPKKVWDFKTGNIINSSPTIYSENIYFGSDNNNFYCLDLKKGKKIWQFKARGKIKSSPSIYKNHIYFGSCDHRVYCLDREKGEKIWQFQTGGEVISKPAVMDKFIYIGSEDRKFYCLNRLGGLKLWDFTTEGKIESSPIVENGRIYLASSDKKIYCLDAKKGEILWYFNTGDKIHSSPISWKNFIYFGSDDTILYCLDGKKGKVIWKYKADFPIKSAPEISEEKIYFGSDKFYCLDVERGKLIWVFNTGKNISTAPYTAEKHIYFGSKDSVYCLDKNTGNFIWEFKTNGPVTTRPIKKENHLYFGSNDGKIYCINTLERIKKISTGISSEIKGNMDELVNRVEEKKELISEISHELGSPLARMQVALDIIEQCQEEGEMAPEKILKKLSESISDMSGLVKELLNLSRLTGSNTIKKKKIDVEVITETVVRKYQHLIDGAGILVKINKKGNVNNICGDEDKIERVIQNLFGNAFDYTPEGGIIEITLEEKEDFFSFTIKDDGPGIEEKYKEKIFDAFFRADPKRKRKTGGTGLGLAIVKKIIKSHSGEIWVENPGQAGAKITFIIPALQSREKRRLSLSLIRELKMLFHK